MATKITPSKEYLQKFTSPLWESLDLEDCTPLMIVEGKQGTFHYMVIEIQHRAYGILSRNGATVVSTFFIVTLPDASAKQRITWHPPAYQVSVDSHHVYLVLLSKKARPRDWKKLIQLTIDVANSLESEDSETDRSYLPRATYTPIGAGPVVNAFCGLGFLVFSLLLVVGGFSSMFGIVEYHPTCSARASGASCYLAQKIYELGGSVGSGFAFLAAGTFLFYGALYYYKKIRKIKGN